MTYVTTFTSFFHYHFLHADVTINPVQSSISVMESNGYIDIIIQRIGIADITTTLYMSTIAGSAMGRYEIIIMTTV